ncbi:MAG: ribonuclease R [Sphingobacteriia bacterium]
MKNKKKKSPRHVGQAPKNKENTGGKMTDLQVAILRTMEQKPSMSWEPTQLLPKLPEDFRDTDIHHLIGSLKELSRRNYLTEHQKLSFQLSLEGGVFEGRLTQDENRNWVVDVPTLQHKVRLQNEGPLPALPDDTVRVRITKFGTKGIKGMMTRVVQSSRTNFVATLYRKGKQLVARPQDTRMKYDFRIPPGADAGGQEGDKVQMTLLRWEEKTPVGRVEKVLGRAGEHNAEMHAIVLEYGLPLEFRPETLEAAAAIPDAIPAEEIARRRDMRSILTFTIDPADAKDFDDAISFRPLASGTYEVGVHIADVSHFLKPETDLDREAQERATSVYLVDRTIPMLPEKLSNNLCSLVPHQDRLCFSAIFVLNDKAQVQERWFGRTVIHSDRRFAYEEAQEIMDRGEGELVEPLLKCNALAHELRARRFQEGSIGFESEEIRFKLDEKGVPLAVYKKERKDVHKMIEDFMLLANREVAKYMHDARKKPPVPVPYRVHPQPDELRVRDLQSFVKNFGYDLKADNARELSRNLNQMGQALEGKPESGIIQSVAIRTMAKAYYTVHNIGHYGLGFDYYTHFTSPIRRYPDVMTHRLLQQVLDADIQAQPEPTEKMLKHCSEREKAAADAERASIKYKQVEYLGAVLGEQFDGMVSGVTDWGMYVELDENKCEGMVGLRDMRDDHYEVDERRHYLKGRHTGRTFRLGDRVRVQVVRTDLMKRIIDFKLVKKL